MIIRKINLTVIMALFVLFFSTKVEAIVNPTSEFYVNDYANILSEKTENYILNKSIDLNDIDGSQIVVVTVNSLEGMSIEEYSLKLFNEFDIGDKYKNNGLLILISLEEREFRVVVGYGFEEMFSDSKIGQIQDEYMVPYFKNDGWDEGIRKGYDMFYDEIYKNADINFLEKNRDTIGIIFVFINLFIGLIFPFIFKLIKNNDLYESEKKISFKCILLYFLFFILIVIIEVMISIDISVLIMSIMTNLIMFAVVYYKTNYKFNRYKDIDRYRRHTRFISNGSNGESRSSGYRGGGGFSRGRGSSRKF